jgi:hypothetical protein
MTDLLCEKHTKETSVLKDVQFTSLMLSNKVTRRTVNERKQKTLGKWSKNRASVVLDAIFAEDQLMHVVASTLSKPNEHVLLYRVYPDEMSLLGTLLHDKRISKFTLGTELQICTDFKTANMHDVHCAYYGHEAGVYTLQKLHDQVRRNHEWTDVGLCACMPSCLLCRVADIKQLVNSHNLIKTVVAQ